MGQSSMMPRMGMQSGTSDWGMQPPQGVMMPPQGGLGGAMGGGMAPHMGALAQQPIDYQSREGRMRNAGRHVAAGLPVPQGGGPQMQFNGPMGGLRTARYY
jgi:hypothetical protein